MKLFIIVCAIALVMFGCAKAPATIDTTTDNSDTRQTTSEGSTQETDTTESQPTTPKECTEAVGFQVLIDAMPSEVNGYVADEPEGNMLTFTDPQTQKVIRYSMASETLTKDDKGIDISLTDTCYVSFLSAAWAGFYEMEGTQGYFKRTTIEGNPGWHQYEKSSESYTYTIFVKERVIVSAQGDNGVPDSDVEAAAKAIDYGAISGAIN
jgi:hypothetical protein